MSLVNDVHHRSEQLFAFTSLLDNGRKEGETVEWFTPSYEKHTRALGFDSVITATAQYLIPYQTWLYRWFCQLTEKEKRKGGQVEGPRG